MTLRIVIGRSYRLRNGSVVQVTGEGTSIIPGREPFKWWTGAVADTGEKMTWQTDGRYPAVDAPPHQWDIVGAARRRR